MKNMRIYQSLIGLAVLAAVCLSIVFGRIGMNREYLRGFNDASRLDEKYRHIKISNPCPDGETACQNIISTDTGSVNIVTDGKARPDISAIVDDISGTFGEVDCRSGTCRAVSIGTMDKKTPDVKLYDELTRPMEVPCDITGVESDGAGHCFVMISGHDQPLDEKRKP